MVASCQSKFKVKLIFVEWYLRLIYIDMLKNLLAIDAFLLGILLIDFEV